MNWYETMAQKYCGRTYGSFLRNVYMFYRVAYGMEAQPAMAAARKTTGWFRRIEAAGK